MNRRAGQLALMLAGFGAVGVATLLTTVSGDGNLLMTFVPFIALGVVFAISRLPLRHTLTGLMLLVLCLDNPFEVPFAGMWRSPLEPLCDLLYDNLHKYTGIQAMRFSLLVVGIVGLLGLALFRRLGRKRADASITDTPRSLKMALLTSFATLVFLELYGIARGGDFKQSLWQFQNLLFMPIVAAVWQLAFRGRQDHGALGKVVVSAACFKTFLGAYFLYEVARPANLVPPYVTQHTDSVLFVAALCILVALWMERPSSKHTAYLFFLGPIILFGIFINERRLAYVSLGVCLFTIFAMVPWNSAKRFVAKSVLLLIPVIVPYLLVGWTSHASVFKPVQALRSVVAPDENADEQADSSTEFRNMENYNLVETWMPNPLMGSGFGHEYNEVILLPDISKFFPAYRYVPHNSVLWLFSIGGALGFTCIWMFLPVAVLMAARSYRVATDPGDRAAALTVICVVITFLNQAFGDMGTQSWVSVFILMPAVVMAGKLAVATRAWPTHAPLFRVPARLRGAAIGAGVPG